MLPGAEQLKAMAGASPEDDGSSVGLPGGTSWGVQGFRVASRAALQSGDSWH